MLRESLEIIEELENWKTLMVKEDDKNRICSLENNAQVDVDVETVKVELKFRR